MAGIRKFLGNLFGAASGAPVAKTVSLVGSSTGIVYTTTRLLGSTSVFALLSGSNSNLTINATTGEITAAAAIPTGTIQTAIVRESIAASYFAAEYPVTIIGSVTSGVTPSVSIAKPGVLGFVLDNQQLNNYGISPFLDKSKSGTTWVAAGNGANTAPVLNSNGYPTAIPSGVERLEQLVGVQGDRGPVGVAQNYVYETSKTDASFGFAGVSSFVDKGIVGGVRRYEFTANPQGFTVYSIYVQLYSLPTPYGDADFNRLFRVDQEIALKAGEFFDPAFTARYTANALVDTLRFMDWLPANRTNVYTWSQRPQLSWASWTEALGVPLEVHVALVNETLKNGHFHLPAGCDRDYAVQCANYIGNHIKPGLIASCEFANETWNFGFGQYGYLYNVTPIIAGNNGDQANRQSGYLGTQRLGVMAKTLGYPKWFRPIWATQATNAAVTRGNNDGVRQAIAEWANPQSPNYDADLAAHFQEPGQLYTGGGAITSYIDGGMLNPNITDADKALVESWAAATDNSGYDAAITQIKQGGFMSSTFGGAYSDVIATLGENIAYFESLGMPVITYEGNIALSIYEFGRWKGGDSTKLNLVSDFFNRLYVYPPMRALFLYGLKLFRTAGITTNTIEADFGGGAYGTITDAYGGTLTQRALAMQDFHANPGATKPLTVATISNDAGRLGDAVSKRISSSGGFGQLTASVSTLAGGTFDNFRTIGGVYTQQTNTPTTVTVTITDESTPPQTASTSFTQNVGSARTYIQGRYLKVAVYEDANAGNRTFYAIVGGIAALAVGATAPTLATWTGDGQNSSAANLRDLDGAAWSSNPLVNGVNTLYGTLDSAITLGMIEIAIGDPSVAPGKFDVFFSNTPFSSSNMGTLILAVNEPDISLWPNNSTRTFYTDTVIPLIQTSTGPTPGSTALAAAPSGSSNPSGPSNPQTNAGFSLSSLTTLQQRFTSKSGVTAPSGVVSQWTDSVGGKVATPVGAAPTLDPNGWATGVPAIVMNNQPLLTNAMVNATQNQGFTLLLVYQSADNNDGALIGSGHQGVSVDINSGQIRLVSEYQGVIGQGALATTVGKHLIVARSTTEYSGGHYDVRIDGSSVSSGYSGAGFNTYNYYIGENPEGGNTFNGSWAVVAVCGSYLDDDTVAQWEAYEKAEWGL